MAVKPLRPGQFPVETVILHTPPLEELAAVLNEGLKKNYQDVKVEVVECPDLTQKPFVLACKGLCGRPTLMEVGGIPYMVPKLHKEKLYDLRDMPGVAGMESAYITGAGAGPWQYVKTNSTCIINLEVKKGKATNQSRVGICDEAQNKYVQSSLPDDVCDNAFLSNLFLSEGKPGKVLKISCKTRTGEKDFAASVRTSLNDKYGKQYVGLGGAFAVMRGNVQQFMMPDFSEAPINTDEELARWIKFYETTQSPIVGLGTLMSDDPGLDIRVQHFHTFSLHGEGGHYLNDASPSTVEYLAYFLPGERLVRVDRPVETNRIGR